MDERFDDARARRTHKASRARARNATIDHSLADVERRWRGTDGEKHGPDRGTVRTNTGPESDCNLRPR